MPPATSARRPTGARITGALLTAAVCLGVSRFDLGGGTWIWAVPATVAVALALIPLIADARARLPAGWLPAVIVGVTAVVYACVPETDHIRWIAVLPVTTAVIEFGLRVRLPFGGSYATVAFVLGAGLYGATGRDSAIVGTLFAWWPFALLTVSAGLAPALRSGSKPVLAAIIAVGGAAAGWVARTGGLQPTIAPALGAVAVAASASLVVTVAAGRLLSGRDGPTVATPRPRRG
ncbi:MAG TPA: hypothetical protein VIS05_03985 [Ilumatobacter sp.]